MPIPEWYRPVPDADPDAFTQAVDRQLDLAQRTYDPTGTFVQQREAEWIVYASKDTRGITTLPAIYQSEQTRVMVRASAQKEGLVQVTLGVGVGEGDDTPFDIYNTHAEEELPMIVALLGSVASVELAEFEAHPRRVVRAIADSAGSSIGLERNFAQKTLELPDAPGGAINLTYVKMTGFIGVCDVRFARQVVFPEGTFLYQQNIIKDDRNPDALYYWPRAFMLGSDMPMGQAYYGTRIKGEELVNRPLPGGIRKSDFEARLQSAGNALVSMPGMKDIIRLMGEPLSPDYRLHT